MKQYLKSLSKKQEHIFDLQWKNKVKEGRRYGGIGWLIKNGLNLVHEVKFTNERISHLELENIIVIGVYLTSNDSSQKSLNEHIYDLVTLENLILSLSNGEKEILIIGDFNSDPLRSKKFDRQLFELMIDQDLEVLDLKFNQSVDFTYHNIEPNKDKTKDTIPKLNWNNINVQIEYQTILEKRLKGLKFIDKLKSV
ncbi:hypothetical protein BpHYR1_013432 [Brachionus plicatilis]|uniref:Endonuclease/exonuclease/phosphatase domain-containing protein n=1 Tax=Brachionus plicatilis TaxID=10195 RepID=A0A3M7Q7V5_BRAPC|nr:hypothetical protein BpHYR1_013432 [Brachionus plicatilis]